MIESNIISRSSTKLCGIALNNNCEKEFINVFKVKKLSTFTKRLNELVNKIDCTDYELGKPLNECKNKVKGDMFELFTIFFFNSFKGDRDILVNNIKWAKRDQVGYDFIASNRKNTPVVIQSKFIGNYNTEFDRGTLETFFGSLPEGYVRNSNERSRILITTASCNNIAKYYINEARESGRDLLILCGGTTKKVQDRNKYVIGIGNYVNDNLGFWKECEENCLRIFK